MTKAYFRVIEKKPPAPELATEKSYFASFMPQLAETVKIAFDLILPAVPEVPKTMLELAFPVDRHKEVHNEKSSPERVAIEPRDFEAEKTIIEKLLSELKQAIKITKHEPG